MRKYINEGEAIPRGYGVAWHDYCSRRSVCYPIGINLLISWGRYIWIAVAVRLPAGQDALMCAFMSGRNSGLVDGLRNADAEYRRGLHDGADQVTVRLMQMVDEREARLG